MPYLRPGAYMERADTRVPSRVLVRTDIAAFVGIAETGPLHEPVPVQSFRQFQTRFGGFTGAGYLAYAVRGFFENGGRRCWVVRVASRLAGWGAASASLALSNVDGALWRVRASTPGSWGNALSLRVAAENRAQAAIDTRRSTPLYAVIGGVAGFARGELVCVSQETAAGPVTEQWRVVADVDATAGRIYWVHPQPGAGLPYDRPLEALDANRPARVSNLTYRLSVYRSGRLFADFGGLSPIPEHPGYGPLRLAEPFYPTRGGAGEAMAADAFVPAPLTVVELRTDLTGIPAPLQLDPPGLLPLRGGSDGLTRLSADDFIGAPMAAADGDEQRRVKSRGIQSLDRIDEIALVAVPDILIRPVPDPPFAPDPQPQPDPCLTCPPPPEPRRAAQGFRTPVELPPTFSDADIYRVQAALVAHCESRGDRFAVLDPPFGAARDDAGGIAAVQAWRERFDTSYAALYYPWLRVPEPRETDTGRFVPACGHVLGQYAFFDNAVGVHRAPANRSLSWIQDLTVHPGAARHELLNPVGINLVRSEGPRGFRPMGARTLASDPDWRYVNVRRLLLTLRKAASLLSEWAVFEPNNAVTRNKLRVVFQGYLSALWSQGALAGQTPEESYFVKCDEETTAAADRDNGRLIAYIGVAPSIPFEFVVVRVGVQSNALEIAEAGALARVA